MMPDSNMKHSNNRQKISGEVCWRSPSNIALIKYWGKKGFQIPANTSLSFALSKSFTETKIRFQTTKDKPAINFQFEGKPMPAFEEKIKQFIEHIKPELPYLNMLTLEIDSYNSFPHSAGIASSASAMSALALGLCSIGNEISGTEDHDLSFYKKASNISRIGSGSAARSVYGEIVTWGKNDLLKNSSDRFASQLAEDIHPLFKKYKDRILIVSKGEKSVSSRVGHSLMKGHPFAEARYSQANENLEDILKALKVGDIKSFISIVENEAMSLHAMMMSSKPGYFLMEPGTLKIIEKIIAFRKKSGAGICFTLDAGPNVHILFPEEETENIDGFIRNDLLKFCENGQMIEDEMGQGPQRTY